MWPKNELNRLVDENYIKHQSDSVLECHSRTFPILQFLIIINLAYYGANWSVSILPYYTEIALNIIMTIINMGLAMSYLRELRINKIIRDEFYEKLINGYGGDVIKKIKNDIKNRDKPYQQFTGFILSFLAILIFTIPAGYLIFLIIMLDPRNKNFYAFLLSVAVVSILLTVITYNTILKVKKGAAD